MNEITNKQQLTLANFRVVQDRLGHPDTKLSESQEIVVSGTIETLNNLLFNNPYVLDGQPEVIVHGPYTMEIELSVSFAGDTKPRRIAVRIDKARNDSDEYIVDGESVFNTDLRALKAELLEVQTISEKKAEELTAADTDFDEYVEAMKPLNDRETALNKKIESVKRSLEYFNASIDNETDPSRINRNDFIYVVDKHGRFQILGRYNDLYILSLTAEDVVNYNSVTELMNDQLVKGYAQLGLGDIDPTSEEGDSAIKERLKSEMEIRRKNGIDRAGVIDRLLVNHYAEFGDLNLSKSEALNDLPKTTLYEGLGRIKQAFDFIQGK